MKIAIDLTSLADNFSGIERYAAYISLNLLRCDDKNQYVLLFKDGIHALFSGVEQSERIKLQVVSSKGRGKLTFSQLMLPKELKKVNADLNLFLAFPSPLFFSRPSLSTIHDLSCWDCPETMTFKSRLLWRVLDGKAVRSKYGILTISEFSKNRIVSHYGVDSEKVHVVYCGIDYDLFDQEKVTASDISRVREKYCLPEHFVMSLSTIEPRKNLSLLVEAWACLRRRDDFKMDLVLAGRKGWKVERLLAGVPPELMSGIHFTGFVDDKDLPVLYQASDLFVYPSLYEGFGLPPVEALASGANVLCSDIPSLKEVCGDSISSFSTGDRASLERAIIGCLNKPHADNAVSARYDWFVEAKRLRKFLDFDSME